MNTYGEPRFPYIWEEIKKLIKGKSTVAVTVKTASGTNIADLNIDGTTYPLYAPSGGGGGTTDYANLTNKPTPADIGAVPTTRTVNGKALSSNITLDASDVGAISTSGGQILGSLTLTGGVTVSGHDSAIGAMWYHGTSTTLASTTSFIEIPNDASDIDLTTGRWLVTAYGGFPTAVTGYVGLAFMIGGTRVSEGSVLIPATSSTSWSTSISTSIIRDVSSSGETISLGYIQNSGTSQNVTWYIRAIRIR